MSQLAFICITENHKNNGNNCEFNFYLFIKTICPNLMKLIKILYFLSCFKTSYTLSIIFLRFSPHFLSITRLLLNKTHRVTKEKYTVNGAH